MTMKNIYILTEAGGDVGLGHVVRMGHLFHVLRQKGHAVFITSNEAGHAYFKSVGIPSSNSLPPVPRRVYYKERVAEESDIVIVDFMNNDDDYLKLLRSVAKKLVVIVGVGWTITPTTRWIADLVVYHTAENDDLYGWTPGETILQGLKYIMMNPEFSDVPEYIKREYDIVTYFGGGLNQRIADALPKRLGEIGYKVFEMGSDESQWNLEPYNALADSKLYVGSMGMMTYEAIVTRTYPMVLCRSEDHIESAERLVDKDLATNFGLFTRPKAEITIDNMTRKIRRKLDTLLSQWSPSEYKVKYLDGKGLYRVALEILKDA